MSGPTTKDVVRRIFERMCLETPNQSITTHEMSEMIIDNYFKSIPDQKKIDLLRYKFKKFKGISESLPFLELIIGKINNLELEAARFHAIMNEDVISRFHDVQQLLRYMIPRYHYFLTYKERDKIKVGTIVKVRNNHLDKDLWDKQGKVTHCGLYDITHNLYNVEFPDMNAMTEFPVEELDIIRQW